MREIRTLRAKRRGLETELRQAGLRRRGAKAAAWPPDAYRHRASPRPYQVLPRDGARLPGAPSCPSGPFQRAGWALRRDRTGPTGASGTATTGSCEFPAGLSEKPFWI